MLKKPSFIHCLKIEQFSLWLLFGTYLNFWSRSLMTTNHETQIVVKDMRQTRPHFASLLVTSYLRHATHMQTDTSVNTNNHEYVATPYCHACPARHVPTWPSVNGEGGFNPISIPEIVNNCYHYEMKEGFWKLVLFWLLQNLTLRQCGTITNSDTK